MKPNWPISKCGYTRFFFKVTLKDTPPHLLMSKWEVFLTFNSIYDLEKGKNGDFMWHI